MSKYQRFKELIFVNITTETVFKYLHILNEWEHIKVLIVCIEACIPSVLRYLPHMSYLYGVSPVCISIYFTILKDDLKSKYVWEQNHPQNVSKYLNFLMNGSYLLNLEKDIITLKRQWIVQLL